MTRRAHLLAIVLAAIFSAACAHAPSAHGSIGCSASIDSVTIAIVPDAALQAGVLIGTVLTAEGGQPVEYAEVTFGHEFGTIVAPDGSFRLTRLASDSIHLVVRRLGYHVAMAAAVMPRSVGGRTVIHLRPNGCPIVG